MKAKRVLLIGWDSADWKIIDHLIARGQMPALQQMIANGVRGNLSTLEPILSPMLWSSIATGKYADKHGIHGFTEPDYEGGLVRPISSTSRKARAIWNILTHQGYKTNVFSWWPSHPAEPINGVCVSNLYQRAQQAINKPWNMRTGTVHPASLTKHFAGCRVHPDELTQEHILPFIPLAAKIDQDKDKRLGAFSKILADAATVHAASTWAIENTEWQFTAVYHDAIDHACHAFMKFRAPQLPGIPDDLFEMYQHAVDGMYRFHDMMLERLLQLAGPDTNVILISDHGFQSDHLRPLQLPKEPAGPAAEHRKHGIICCYGPDFKKGQTVYGSSILDITPTLLTLFGLPVGEDMDGTPLLQVFETQPTVKKIPSWEEVEGNFGEHPKDMKLSTEESGEALKQLVELGYIEDPGEDASKAIKKTETELKYNLSKVYSSTGRPKEALQLLLEVNEGQPEFRFQLRIADCYKRMEQFDECEKWIDRIKKEDADSKHTRSIQVLEAEVLLMKGETQEALRLLLSLNEQVPNSLTILRLLAECHVQMKDWKSAERIYRGYLTIDPNDATAFRGLALSLLQQERYEEAVDSALSATELIYQYPSAHHVLGEALFKMGEYEMAAKSLEVAHAMRPSHAQPRLLLDRIYAKHGIKREQLFQDVSVEKMAVSSLHQKVEETVGKSKQAKSYKGRNRGEIVIVSGLPRSGTSLMMQMLEAGGVDICTDRVRQPDENNPKGFYEHEKVKSLGKKNNWLDEARGKALKVVSPLVRFLPPTYNYKMIVMERAISEVLTSQHQMLVRDGKAKADRYPLKLEETLKKTFKGSMMWLKNQPNIQTMVVRHADVMNDPENTAREVAQFLGKELNITAMAACVDKGLHRHKVSTNTAI